VEGGVHRRRAALAARRRATEQMRGVPGPRRRMREGMRCVARAGGLGRLAWACRAASCCACSAIRARARRVDTNAVQLPWRGHLARPEARGHLAACGRAPARSLGPRASGYGRKYADLVGTPRHADVATSRPERAGALNVSE
jgi:hypothetical protein